MDISELRKRKKEAGFTNARIAELSGVPFSTVNKIFSGATDNPRIRTYLAIEAVLSGNHRVSETENREQM